MTILTRRILALVAAALATAALTASALIVASGQPHPLPPMHALTASAR